MKENNEAVETVEAVDEERTLAYKKSLKEIQWMWEEKTKLGEFPPHDIMEGVDRDIKMVRAINSCSRNSSQE